MKRATNQNGSISLYIFVIKKKVKIDKFEYEEYK